MLWLRATAVGSVAVLLGVAGHVSADGLLPGLGPLAAMLVGAVLMAVPLLARPASALRLVVVTVGGQALLHLGLTLTAGHAGDPVAAAPAPRAGALDALPTVDGRRVGSLHDAYAAMAGEAAPAPALPVGRVLAELQAHAPMMLVHVGVAVLVGLWLARGERCLFTVLALTRRVVLRLVVLARPVRAEPTRLRPAAAHRVPVLRDPWLVRPASRRGPPLLAA